MRPEASITGGLLLGVAALVLAQLAVAGALLLRSALADLWVRRWTRRSQVLRDLLTDLESEPSLHVRRELATRALAGDLRRLETWLEIVSNHGHDPAGLEPAVFEEAGLVDRALRQLHDDRRWVRRAAAAGLLGWTGSPRAVRPLLEVVRDRRSEVAAVRAAALRALGRIRHADAVGPLVETLSSDESWLPPLVASMLARIGEPALLPLIERLEDDATPTPVRRWAAQILGDIGHRRALIPLVRALSDLDAEIRARAAKSIGRLGDERGVDALLERLLVDPVPFVRISVARGLSQLASERTLQFLVEALADPEWWVRLRAVQALEHLGPVAREVLVATLSDPDPQVGREAARALEGIGAVADALQVLRSEGYRPDAGELLVDVGRAGNLEPLLDELESNDENVLREIVRIVARIGDRRAGREVALLIDRVRTPSLRARVIDTLRRIGDDAHVERIVPFLAHENEWIRKSAIDYVADFARPDVVESVLPLVEDENPWTRESALRVLERLAPKEARSEAVVARLADHHDFVRAQAVRTLCAARGFEELLASEVPMRLADEGVREALLDGMRETADASALPLLLQLAAFASDRDLSRLAERVRTAVATLPTARVDELLQRHLSPASPVSARWLAAAAWTHASAAVRAQTADRILADPDPRVRAAVLVNLARGHDDPDWLAVRIGGALSDEAPVVVREALRAAALARLRRLWPTVRALGRHPDDEVRVDRTLAAAFLARPTELARTGALDPDPRLQVAAVLGRMAVDDEQAVGEWLRRIAEPSTAHQIERWIEDEHPLVREILRRAQTHESLASRLLLCRSLFDAERVLLDELETCPDERRRQIALEGLTAVGSERCAGRIVSTFLKDSSAVIRAHALEYLVRQNVYGRRRHFLSQAFLDPEEVVQIRAAHLCGGLEREEAVPLLARQLVTRRPRALQAVTDMLAGFMEDGGESVIDEVLGQPHTPELLMGLISVLEKTTADVSTELLEVLFTHRWARVRSEALRALLVRAEDPWSVFRRALADPAPSVRARAAEALGARRHGRLREDLVQVRQALDELHLDPSPEVRSRVALALAAIDVPGRVRILDTLRHDSHERVRRLAGRVARAVRRQRTAERARGEPSDSADASLLPQEVES